MLEAAEVHLHVAYKHLCQVERGYDGYVIRVASLLDMTGRCCVLCTYRLKKKVDASSVNYLARMLG